MQWSGFLAIFLRLPLSTRINHKTKWLFQRPSSSTQHLIAFDYIISEGQASIRPKDLRFSNWEVHLLGNRLIEQCRFPVYAIGSQQYLTNRFDLPSRSWVYVCVCVCLRFGIDLSHRWILIFFFITMISDFYIIELNGQKLSIGKTFRHSTNSFPKLKENNHRNAQREEEITIA